MARPESGRASFARSCWTASAVLLMRTSAFHVGSLVVAVVASLWPTLSSGDGAAMARAKAAAPRPDPATRGVALSPERGGTDFEYASAALNLRWKHPGGDYLDAEGVVDGPNPHAQGTVGWKLTTLDFDISKFDDDLLLRFEGGPAPVWSTPLIDGVPAEAFWVDASSNHPLSAPMHMPAFIRNPGHGKRLSIRIDNVYQPGRVQVDPVAAPGVGYDPPVKGGLAAAVKRDSDLGRNPNVLRYLELRNEPMLRQLLPRGTMAEPFAYHPEWITGPGGLPALRVSSDPKNPRLISWFLHFDSQEEVYARYCILIEDDVADGMNELGVKLPGLAGDEVSWRMEHGPVAPGNRGLYAALDYIYAADTGSGFGQIRDMGAVFEAGRWYTIEQYVRLNTIGQADGVGKVWINGRLTWQSSTVRYRNDPKSRMNQLHINIYHGGMNPVKAPIHYRVAGIVVAKAYLGPPPELSSTP